MPINYINFCQILKKKIPTNFKEIKKLILQEIRKKENKPSNSHPIKAVKKHPLTTKNNILNTNKDNINTNLSSIRSVNK